MASFNKVILMGNLTRDPQVRYTPSGAAVAELSLAVNRSWFDKQSNSRKEETTFVDVTVWGRTAEIAGEYLAKGRSVMIEGRLQLDQWEDRESGKKRSKLKVVGESMTMVGGRGEGGGGGGGRPQQGGGQQAQQSQSAPPADYNQQQPPAGNSGAESFYEPPSDSFSGDDVPF